MPIAVVAFFTVIVVGLAIVILTCGNHRRYYNPTIDELLEEDDK